MKIKVKCPKCGELNDVTTSVRLQNYQHQIVTCDSLENNCSEVFVVVAKFSVKIEVSTLKKVRG